MGSQNDEIDKLFSEGGPSSAGGQKSGTVGVPYSSGGEPSFIEGTEEYKSTLDESIWATLGRDAKRIGQNLLMVVFPFRYGLSSEKAREEQLAALRNWDLWGPLIFTLILAATLSLGEDEDKDRSVKFSLCFITLAIGAVVLFLNITFLGGNIVFFQALCLVGYCIFPLDIAAIITVAMPEGVPVVKVVATTIGILWSCWASVPFMQESAPVKRKFLAVYPLVLLYMFIGFLIITT